MNEFDAPEPVQLRELMARNFEPPRLESKTHCVQHAIVAIAARPIASCRLCALDVQEYVARTLHLNEWLNNWIDDARDVLTRQDAALQHLQGWDTRTRVPSNLQVRSLADALAHAVADVIKPDLSTELAADLLVSDVTPETAGRLLDFFQRVLEVADGTVSLVGFGDGGSRGRHA